MTRKRIAFTLCLLLVALMTTSAYAKKNLTITEVSVDDPNNPTSITITGRDFLIKDPLRIFLGEFPELTPTGPPTNTQVQALLPVGILPGDYLLLLKAGKDKDGDSDSDSDRSGRTSDEYDLTIGAVGPAGADGADGQDGSDGATGLTSWTRVQGGAFKGGDGCLDNNFCSMQRCCPGGRKVLGGGLDVDGTLIQRGSVHASESFPATNSCWRCTFKNNSGSTRQAFCWTICAFTD